MKGGTSMAGLTPSIDRLLILHREELQRDLASGLECSLDTADQLLDLLWFFAMKATHKGQYELRFNEACIAEDELAIRVTHEVPYHLATLLGTTKEIYPQLLQRIRTLIELPDGYGTLQLDQQRGDSNSYFVLLLIKSQG